MLATAFNQPPKKYMGWNIDPENPEYQKRLVQSNKIYSHILKKVEKSLFSDEAGVVPDSIPKEGS